MVSAPSARLCFVASTARWTLLRTRTTSASFKSAILAIRSSTSAIKLLISLEAAALMSLTPSLKSPLRRRPLARACSVVPSNVDSIVISYRTQRTVSQQLWWRPGTQTIGSHPTLPVGIAPHAKLYKLHRGQSLDILLALDDRGFLLQDGDVPPRGYCELH